MTHLPALLLCLSGFMALALAMARQQQAILGRALRANTTRGLRAAGWSALALALWFVVGRQGWALGLVSFSGHTSLAAGLVHGALIVTGRRSA
jgi:hypothetical protein